MCSEPPDRLGGGGRRSREYSDRYRQMRSRTILADVSRFGTAWFYGVDQSGRTALFGRGGVFNADPVKDVNAKRFTALSWATAIEVAGPLIQPKALRYAQSRARPFEVGRPNERACTNIGEVGDAWAAKACPVRALRIALLGCGIVGHGVYEIAKRYPERFEIGYVFVSDVAKHPDIAERTVSQGFMTDESIDVVIECLGGIDLPCSLISAAVGGVLPALETLDTLVLQGAAVREIRGILNGTCGVVSDALADGKSLPQAIALAKAGGFAEADPARDLSGRDSADKLALMIEASFGRWLPSELIPTRGIAICTRWGDYCW
jgi:homoserine dehydrogenase